MVELRQDGGFAAETRQIIGAATGPKPLQGDGLGDRSPAVRLPDRAGGPRPDPPLDVVIVDT
jgi:hypothetical protein